MSTPDLRQAALSVLSPGFVGTELPDWLHGLLQLGLGGVWLFGHNVVDDDQVRALTAQIHQANPQALVCSDEEGGTVTRVDHRAGSPWPGPWALGRADDVALTRQVACAMGRRLAGLGIDLAAAPVADVNSEPQNPVIGTRSFGSATDLVARHVAAAVAGLAKGGVLGCAKHFPGHGSTTQDSHLTLPTLHVSPELLHRRDLEPFRAAVEAGVETVMTGHLVVPAYGPEPATLNPTVLTLLREGLGFDGVVCTDAIDMEAVARETGRSRSVVLALAAGVDLVCVGNPCFPRSYDAEQDVHDLAGAVEAAVRSGELPAARLQEAARRVLALGAGRAARRAADAAVPACSAARVHDLGRKAAAAALECSGTPTDLRHPLVVGASSAGNIASGARQEVVLTTLAEELGGKVVELQELGTSDDTRAPVVLVVDDHTTVHDPEVADALARAEVVVHTGILGLPPRPAGQVLVRTYSGGRASALAAAHALVAGPA